MLLEEPELLRAPAPQPKKKINSRCSPYVMEVLTYWNEKGLRVSKPETKMYARGIRLLKSLEAGKVFMDTEYYSKSKFPIEDIKLAIDRFHQATIDYTFYPVDKKFFKHTSLDNFIFRTFPKAESLLYRFLQNPPIQRLNDDYPILKNILMNLYRKEILGDGQIPISFKNTQRFVKASTMLKEYFLERRGRIRPGVIINDKNLADWLYKAVIQDTKEVSIISPGFFCSEETFTRRLPTYLNKIGIFR